LAEPTELTTVTRACEKSCIWGLNGQSGVRTHKALSGFGDNNDCCVLDGGRVSSSLPSHPSRLNAPRPVRKPLKRAFRHARLVSSSFITVAALSPTFATAASISSVDFWRRFRQRRAKSLVETSTRFLGAFALEDVSR
jgi:hypothetical protein